MRTVSVVIPTHNRATFLLAALESVRGQEFQDFEVIVVDDGSTDRTSDRVNSIDDSRVRYVYQENAGRSAARNRGLALATGRFVAFLDDDDMYLPHKLGNQVRYLDEHPEVDLVGGSARLVSPEGTLRGVWPGIHQERSLELTKALYDCPLMPSTVMVRRDAIDRIGENFDSSVEPIEDKEFFLRLLLHGSTAIVQPEVVTDYRIHPENSQRDASHNTRRHLRCLDKIVNDPRASASLKEEIPRIEPYAYFFGALHAYSTDNINAAHEFLQKAVVLDPVRLADVGPTFADRVAGYARTFHVVDPAQFIDRVFDNLPPGLEGLRRYRGRAHGAYHVERVFSDQKAHLAPNFTDWFQAVLNWPKLLANRGIWSILARNILGDAVKSARRHTVDLIRTNRQAMRSILSGKRKTVTSSALAYEAALYWFSANRLPGAGIAVSDLNHHSYPEVTGYIIPTLLECGERDLALDLGRWLISVQRPDGGWSGPDQLNASYIFDTAQVIRGLLAVTEFLPEARGSIRRAADWLLSESDAQGVLRPASESAWFDQYGHRIPEDIHLYALPPLAAAGRLLGDLRYIACVDRSIAYYLDKPELVHFRYLTHFYGYVLEALTDLGYEDKAAEGLDEIIRQQRPDGAIPAEPNVSWVCSPGIAQLAIVGYKLGRYDFANRALDYMQSLQMPSGGFRGSSGAGAAYAQDAEISWATKYYLDACNWRTRTASVRPDPSVPVGSNALAARIGVTHRGTPEVAREFARFARASRTARARRNIVAGFVSYESGDALSARKAFLRAFPDDPSWIRNRGVMSIIVRSTIASILGSAQRRTSTVAMKESRTGQ